MNKWTFFLLSFIFLSACNTTRTASAVPDPQPTTDPADLDGRWELTYITGPRIAFEGLYPTQVPFIKFNTNTGELSGNTSCNPFTGTFSTEGSRISFEGIAATMKACPGEGEAVFQKMLGEANRYRIVAPSLYLLKGELELMRFEKQ